MARLAWLTITLTLLLAGGAQAQTLERIRETGTFKLGYREDAAPFSFRNALGEPAGFSVELCRLVAAEAKAALGLDQITIEYVPLGTEDRFQAVQAGRVDILCGATTVTLSRRELVDFSLVIFLDGAAVLLRADGPEGSCRPRRPEDRRARGHHDRGSAAQHARRDQDGRRGGHRGQPQGGPEQARGRRDRRLLRRPGDPDLPGGAQRRP